MRTLILFECSRVVASAFENLGHEAWSCDLKPSEVPTSRHLQMDFREALALYRWDLIIMHPACTYLSVSGIHWNNRGRGWEKTEAALADIRFLMEWCAAQGISYCLENPVSIISSRIRKPDQTIQPYMFGDDASKKTCLWLWGLPLLRVPPPDEWYPPRAVCRRCKANYFGLKAEETFSKGCPSCGEEAGRMDARWSNQTDSGQNRLGPSESRATNRARTYPGIARAMAATWGERNA